MGASSHGLWVPSQSGLGRSLVILMRFLLSKIISIVIQNQNEIPTVSTGPTVPYFPLNEKLPYYKFISFSVAIKNTN